MKPVQLEQTKRIKALIYGDSGSGKTTLLGSAMECEAMAPVLVLNARGQPISLNKYDPPPLVLEVETFKDFNIPYAWFQAGQTRGWKAVGQDAKVFTEIVSTYLDRWGFDKFNTLAVDSITHVQRRAVAQATGQQVVKPGDQPKPTEIQQWGSVLRMMSNLTDLYFKLPVNVLMTALTRRDTIESLGLTLFCPFLWGQSALEVPSHAELLGRLVVAQSLTTNQRKDLGMARDAKAKDGPYNVLLLGGGRHFMAKWQGVSNSPDSVPAPTMSKLWEVLMAS